MMPEPCTRQMRTRRRWAISLAVAGVCCATMLLAPTAAQEDPQERAVRVQQMQREVAMIQAQQVRAANIQIVGQAPGGDDANPQANMGVFVRDSAVAAEKMALAERMERLQEWETAAEVYQEVLDQFADRVIATHSDAQGRPDRFGSVTNVVQQRIAGWPPAGRDVYIGRYELTARRLLDAANASDAAALTPILNRYFITDAGRDAAIRLIELAFDRAEFVAAATLCDRLIDSHPNVGEHKPLLLTRSALGWHLAGENARAAARGKLLAADYADARATIGGEADRSLAALVTAELAHPRRVSLTTRTTSWPMPFGSNDHAAVAAEVADASTAGPREWGKLMSFEIDAVGPRQGGPEFEQLRPQLQRQRELGAMNGILPAVDDGQLFFQDNTSLRALDLSTGQPLRGWQQTYPNENGRYRVEGFTTPRGAQMSVTLTERSVLAILGQSEPSMRAYFPNGGAGGAAIVCLDRASGKVQWSMKPGEFKTADETVRNTEPCGSVLVVNDSVYVVARARRTGAFEDSYLCCLSLADGSLRWARHLASGNASQQNFDFQFPLQNVADSHLAYADGRVYVCTDMGAIAAIEAADGSLGWLSVYPRPRAASVPNWINIQAGAGSGRVEPAYAGNPVIVRDGKLITLPVDAEHLFVHDAATGQELARVPMKWNPRQRAKDAPANKPDDPPKVEQVNVLAGITGNSVVLSSSWGILMLDWAKLAAPRDANASTELPLASVLTLRKEIANSEYDDDGIRGRPFVTDRSIYVSTAWRLFRLTSDTLTAVDQYPKNDTLDVRQEESPGNVTVVNGAVFVASADRLAVYAELSLLRQRLEAAIAADPRSVAPRLRYAEAMFNTARVEEAVQWIDAAVAQITPESGLVAPGPDRDAIFDVCMQMVRRISVQKEGRDPALARRIVERVARTADTPAQQVSYRLADAALARQEEAWPRAVEIYQALLDEPTWSSLKVKVADDVMPVRQLATAAIDQVLAKAGRGAYAPVEARARAELDRLRAAGSEPAQLFSVIERFPNAAAGKEAVRLAADAVVTNAAAVPSRAMLRRLSEYLTEPDAKLALNESLFRSYLAAGDIAAALGRARRIAAIDPQRVISAAPAAPDATGRSLPSAADVPVGRLIAQLQERYFDEQERRLPDLKANLNGPSFDLKATVEVPQIAALLVPPPERSRNDRLIALGREDRFLKIFAPGSPKPLQSINVGDLTDRAGVQWDGDRLYLNVPGKLACVDAARGTTAWTIVPAKLPKFAANIASLVVDDSGIAEAAAAAAAPAAPAAPEERQLDLALQQAGNDPQRLQQLVVQRRVMAQQRLILRNRVLDNGMGIAWEADPRDPNNAEVFTVARLAGASDERRVVAATNRGRIVGAEAATGRVAWQVSFGDRAPAFVRCVDDLVVIAGSDETSSRLLVLNATDGSEVFRRTFSGDARQRICNVGVSPEGWLVVVQADGLIAWDLLGGDREPIGNLPGVPSGGQWPFLQARQPDHLAFCGDKLLVASDVNTPQQVVRLYDLPHLQPTRMTDTRSQQQVERRLMPGYAKNRRTGNEGIEFRVHRDRVLISTGLAMTSVSVLDAQQVPWDRTLSDTPSALSQHSPLLVRSGLIVIGWPREMIGQSTINPHLELYSRETVEGNREVGMIVDQGPENDEGLPLGRRDARVLDAIQPVDGGVAYVLTNGKMIFLPGKPDAATK